MRILSNDSNDGTAGQWAALDGESDSSGDIGPANVAYDELYSYVGNAVSFQHSAMIRGGSGAKSEDIYYFNVDENEVHGFRRLGWNNGSTNWSGNTSAGHSSYF